MLCLVIEQLAFCFSSIVNLPGESTLRREFLRLQQENKNRSDPHRQQQQLKDQEKYKKQLLTERQKRIEQQKEQRRRLEDVRTGLYCCSTSHHKQKTCLWTIVFERQEGCVKLSAQPVLSSLTLGELSLLNTMILNDFKRALSFSCWQPALSFGSSRRRACAWVCLVVEA